MKVYQKHLIALTAVAVLLGSCSKEYFNRPPKSQITIDNFYQNAEQVKASTLLLYSAPWFGYCGKGGWSITEISGGNGRTYSPDIINFQDFSVTATNFEIAAVWNSLFIEISQANAVINNLPAKVPAAVDRAVVNNALGEARLWRALAYFHLVRIFGPVPIVENTFDYINDFQIPRNPVTDVYKFIINDLKFAEANCYTAVRSGNSPANARVSSGSASALLAKVYLNMQDYGNALTQANKVINSGEFKLYGIDIPGKTFADLFLTINNNNEESIVALQWAGNAGYGRGNPFQGSVAYNSQITGTGDGYGQMGPTFDLQDKFDPNDLRRKATFMLPGDRYPEINQSSGGYTLPADASSQGTHAQVKKYVVGTPADNGGSGGAQSSANNTYLMRYAELFLIKAEAIMAGAKTSTNADALAAINTIRRRAGLGNLTVIDRSGFVPNPNYVAGSNQKGQHWTTVYQDDLLDERRREFAFENDYFFDLMRLDGFNKTDRPIALQIIKQQDKGASDNQNPPNRYGDGYLTNITSTSFVFPIPVTETAANPRLLQPPVPYVFK